jgi:hypothetical protein
LSVPTKPRGLVIGTKRVGYGHRVGNSGGTLRKISKYGAFKYRVCLIHEQ